MNAAPTPTNEQQDARERAIEAAGRVFGWQYLARYSRQSPEWLASLLGAMVDAALAAVSAAAPDEREAEAWRRYPAARDKNSTAAMMRGLRAAQERDAFRAGWDAALAARPAPVVSGEAVLTTEQRDDAVWALCDYDTDLADRGGQPSDEHWSTRLDDVNRVLAALGITVAVAPAAEPVEFAPNVCICGPRAPFVVHTRCPIHGTTPAAEPAPCVGYGEHECPAGPMCAPAADDEGGQGDE